MTTVIGMMIVVISSFVVNTAIGLNERASMALALVAGLAFLSIVVGGKK